MSERPEILPSQYEQLKAEYPEALARIDDFIAELDDEERQAFLAEAADPVLVADYYKEPIERLRERIEKEVTGYPNYVTLSSLREALLTRIGNLQKKDAHQDH